MVEFAASAVKIKNFHRPGAKFSSVHNIIIDTLTENLLKKTVLSLVMLLL